MAMQQHPIRGGRQKLLSGLGEGEEVRAGSHSAQKLSDCSPLFWGGKMNPPELSRCSRMHQVARAFKHLLQK